MLIKKLLLTILLLFPFIFQFSSAKEPHRYTAHHFVEVEDAIQRIPDQIEKENILVIFDIDNTLLKMTTDLGSEHWFLWQMELLQKGLSQLPLVANSVEDLLKAQARIYQARPMKLVEPRQHDWIKNMQKSDVQVIALTSRILDVQSPTVRELQRNNLELARGSDLNFENEGVAYLPYDLANPEKSGLSLSDLKQFNVAPAKPILFRQGVFFTQGQNKGIILKTILAKLKRNFKAIVFIDDRKSHTDNVSAIAPSLPAEFYVFHYTQSTEWTIPFYQSDKHFVENEWCEFFKEVRDR